MSEVLIPADGIGELALVLPTLARLTRAGRRIVVVAPPYRLHAPGWHNAGIALAQIEVVDVTTPKDALWATEQCLRSAACAAVLCWPPKADDHALRRLQVAAETGQALGFAFRNAREARNPSPAALRLQLDAGNPPAQRRRGQGGRLRQRRPDPGPPSARHDPQPLKRPALPALLAAVHAPA